MDSTPGALTLLLHRMKSGDQGAESELFEQLYSDLKRIARRLLSVERPNQTLTPTGLVHCAYLRLREIDPEAFQDHQHFLRVAAKVMRQLLVDQARAYKAAKRSGGLRRVMMNDSLLISDSDADTILSVSESLERLRADAPQRHDVVELHYFAGYTFEEVASILGISDRTAKRHWVLARIWLRGVIDDNASRPAS
jgi:RNA polymerase sigma factor (TIGR02999 family)